MKDTNLKFRPYFVKFCFTKKNLAFCLAKAYIESLHLKNLALNQQVFKIREEKELHKKKIDDFENKEYFNFINNDHQLYNVFIAYLLFFYRDEEAILEECFILNERYKLLSNLLLETIAQLPLFTYSDLINNKKNVVFYELNQKPFGISDEEYSRMRNWQTNQKLPPDSSLEQLFDQTFEDGICQSNKAKAEFKMKYSSKKMEKAKYHSVLLRKQNKVGSGIKMLDYPEYYRYLPVRENVKRIFIDNCILHKDIENQQLELIKTIGLFEKNKFIDNELFMMDREVVCTPQDFDFIVHQMKYVISILEPDSGVINQWQQAITLANKSIDGKIPMLFIIENLVDTFKGIYRQAVNNLHLLFYYQSSERKKTYISEQINDLIYLESNIPEKGPTINACIADLMIHFRSEVDNMLFQKNNKLTKMEDLLNDTIIQDKKKLSFKLKKSPELLMPIIQALIDRFGLLDSNTTFKTLMQILTSDDLDTITEKIYLGCKTNEFSYMRNHLKTYFKSFNPATIGKSGIFISNIGNTISAASLYNAEIENLQTKIGIDNIFNQKQQKNT